MTTPDEPQNPYGANPPQEPQPPAQPSYGAPQAPQYPAAPQYGAPQAPQYGAPQEPQYGAPQAPQYGASPYPAAPQYGAAGYGFASTAKNSLGVWALVLGIVSIVACGLFAGIPAIIVGNHAKRAVAEGQANNGGMATAGVILGWISIALTVLGIIFGIIAFAASGGSTS
jgi:hypothetical protein